jgi:hypothetical protein
MTGKEDGRTCATCRFCCTKTYSPGEVNGTKLPEMTERSCRIYPPSQGCGWFPIVNADDWCGSWSAEVPKAEAKVDGWHE